MSRRVVLIVPCFNEAERLDRISFLRFLASHPHVSILFVNDGSTDRTAQLLHQICVEAGIQRASSMELPQNRGKAEAVRQGMLAAHRQSPDALVGYWDADLATPLESVENFRRVFETRRGTAVVWGSRIRLQGRRIERKILRGLLGRVFAFCAARIVPISLYDTQCGAKLFHPKAIEPLFDRPFRSRWIFDVELLTRLSKNADGVDELVYEEPLDQWTEMEGSKLRLRDFLRASFELASLGFFARHEPVVDIELDESADVAPIVKPLRAA